MACPCCNPPNPCSVLVDGERVPVSSFNPYDVISVQWRGLTVPFGRDVGYIDGVLVADNPVLSYSSISFATREGCDTNFFQQALEDKGLFLAPGGAGIVNACNTSLANSKHIFFASQYLTPTTCRVYGGIGTTVRQTACLVDGVPFRDTIQEENRWEWECIITNGVPGAVTVSPTVGARYFNNEPVSCGVTHEAPVVTLTFIP
jgi:hypothetical protein